MRTELFSVRSSPEEVALLDKNIKKIVTDLDHKSSIRVLFKTEINRDPRAIKKDLMSSLVSDNPPELYIYANALSTKDSASFRRLFTPLLERIEKELPAGDYDEDTGLLLYPNIKVYPLDKLDSDYPAYCFTIQNKKVLVLPRITLVGEDISEYLCKAVNCAKEIFSRAFDECREGYIYLPKEKALKKLMKKRGEKTPVAADTEKTTEAPLQETAPKKQDSPKASDPHKEAKEKKPAPEKKPVAKAEHKADNSAHNTLADELMTIAEDHPVHNADIPVPTQPVRSKTPKTPKAPKPTPSEPMNLADELVFAAASAQGVTEEEVPSPKKEKEQSPAPKQKEKPEEEAKNPSQKNKEDKKSQKKETEPAKDSKKTSETKKDKDTKKETKTQKNKNTESKTQEKDQKKDSKAKDKKKDKKEESKPSKDKDTSLAAVTDSPDEIAEQKSEPKKKRSFKAFLRSFIPMKGDSARALTQKIVVLVAIAAFITATVMLCNFYLVKPAENKKIISEIQELFYGTVIKDADGNIIATGEEKNWEALKEVNDEIVGWIKIDDTDIDYPVLFHKEDNADSQYYLYRNYKQKPSDFGSIFVDYRCVNGAAGKQVILHGHNMSSDGSMFTELLNYSRKDGWTEGNMDYYKKHPLIQFDTPDGDADWVIFSVMKVNVSNSNKSAFNYLMGEFDSDAQFMNFIYNVKEMSYIDVDVPMNESDRIITLSTCSYEQKNNRTIIMARQLREGEDLTDIIGDAQQHTPVSKVSSSFSKELEANNITWYDGAGNLDGDEAVEFLEPDKIFTVKFVDANGKTLAIQEVLEGEDATDPDIKEDRLRKKAEGGYYFEFTGWDKSFKNVTKNLTIRPKYNKIKMTSPPTEATTERVTEPEETTTNNTPIVTDPPEPTQKPTVPTEPKVTDPPQESNTTALTADVLT
ncbi:MAG: sortase [Ruminococcus sp.]|nr:sortase [Ruminococcus sp.]